MARRGQRTIEILTGNGALESNGQHLPVAYRVEVSVTELETMPGEWIDGQRKIEGAVNAEDQFALMGIYFSSSTDATLHMENHQHFDCSLSNVNGTHGRLVARGNKRAEGSLYFER